MKLIELMQRTGNSDLGLVKSDLKRAFIEMESLVQDSGFKRLNYTRGRLIFLDIYKTVVGLLDRNSNPSCALSQYSCLWAFLFLVMADQRIHACDVW